MINKKIPELAGACYGGVINFKFLRLNTLKRLAGFYGLNAGLKSNFKGEQVYAIFSGCVTYDYFTLKTALTCNLKPLVRKNAKNTKKMRGKKMRGNIKVEINPKHANALYYILASFIASNNAEKHTKSELLANNIMQQLEQRQMRLATIKEKSEGAKCI